MKYIIDVPEGTKWIEAYYTVDHIQYQGQSTMVDSLIPYTEFNRETIENEVWELADYVVRMGVQERNLCFGFQFTTEVTANLTYQEAKAKFEAWLKKKDDNAIKQRVIELADEIGIHKLYAIVRDIRGEEE